LTKFGQKRFRTVVFGYTVYYHLTDADRIIDI